MMRKILLGNINYLEAYHRQLAEVENVAGGADECLIICSHPSVVTLGKKSTKKDLKGWDGDVYEIERGGQATYHGPGQIIIYPIVNLKNRGQNIAGFLESLESSMIAVLSDYSLSASGNTERGKPDFTGVWVGDQKVASIGVAVKRWVTYHGLALNISHDPVAFKGINPCGFSSGIMTSLDRLTDKHFTREEVEESLTNQLIKSLSAL